MKNTINVTMVTDWNCNSGIFTYSKFLIEELNKYNCEVDIIPIDNPHMFDPVYFSLKNFSLKNIIKFLNILIKILRINERHNIIHFQEPIWVFSPVIFLLILFKKKAKVVTTMHEVYFKTENKPLILKIHRKIVNWFIKKCSDIIILHSAFLKDIVLRDIIDSECDIVVIPHGAYQNPVFLDKDLCKKKLELQGHEVITVLGYIDERKGYDRVLGILPKLDSEVIFLVAGGLPNIYSKSQKACFNRLKKEEERGRVKITGYLSDEEMSIVLNASDILLFPYTRVTQSGTLNIALAYRKPVIASDLPYFREISRDYKCVEIAKSDEEFLEKIKKILGNKKLERKLVKSTYNYWIKNSWREVAKKHINVYRRLLNE